MAEWGEYTELEYDHREGDPIILECLEFDHDYLLIERTLTLFDYQQGDAGIERKSVDDFIQSYRKTAEDQTNIWDQCNRMASQDEIKPYLIIVGTEADVGAWFNARHETINMEEFYGAMGSIISRYGFSVSFVPSSEAFAMLAAKIFHSHRHGKAGQLRQMAVTAASKYSAVAKVLALVPGIDRVALDIVEQLQLITPRDIWTLDQKKLETVGGIGKKKAEAIIDYFGI